MIERERQREARRERVEPSRPLEGGSVSDSESVSEKCPGQSRSRATVVADATHQIEWGGRVRDVKEPAIHRN